MPTERDLPPERWQLLVAVLASGMSKETRDLYLDAILHAGDRELYAFLADRYARCRPAPAGPGPLLAGGSTGRRVARKVPEEESPWQENAIRALEDAAA